MSKTVLQMIEAPTRVDGEDLAEDTIRVSYRLGLSGTLAKSGLSDGEPLPHDTSYHIRRAWTTQDARLGKIAHVVASKFVTWS